MPHAIEASTLRILKPTGETVGTGFLVSKNLAVTCAHVVKILGARAEDTIDIRFTGKSTATTARVLPDYWRPDDSTDIAILHVDDVPAGVFPLRMGRASESRLKNDLYTFGYAIAADEQGIGGLGTFITLKQEGNFIQFRMHEANHGHSGAPIYDGKRGVVVGMVKKGHTGTGRNAETTFAIPTETIWQVCPDLRPIIPPLPRRNPILDGINLLPYDYDVRIQNFLTEYLGTDSHPVPFGGRDEALKMLDTWLAETTPYLLLAAPAGRGKSALLVRWLDSLKAREDLSLIFIPVSIRFGTNMESVFYAALAARLAFLHGDEVPASPETSTAVYRGLVSDYLSKPLASGRTLLVVLDGLDEAADWQAGADFMPGELPAGVRVVVSARFLAGDADSTPWLGRLNWERNGLAAAPSLIPLDRAGVADVLLKMGCPLDELSRNVDIVAELYRLSEGDPLLVGLYVGDLWAKGEEVTRLQPEDLAAIQPGYKGYFDRWWDDQKKLWKDKKPWLEKHVRAVRNLLAGALGPLFKNDFHALDSELESDYINDALDVLQRFVIGDNDSHGYTFSHPKLGQYLWDALAPIEKTKVEECFLAWSEQTLQEFIDGRRDPKKKAESPAYVVRSYSAHLTRSNQPIEKWLQLINHQQWAQAWFTVEGAYGGYLQDVHRVQEQCQAFDRRSMEEYSRAPCIGHKLRCALIKSSLYTLMESTPAELIPVLVKQGIWSLPQACVFIRYLSRPVARTNAIIGLAESVENKHLTDVLEMTLGMEEDKLARTEVLTELSKRLPEAELLSLLEYAQAIKDEQARAEVLIELSKRLPEAELLRLLEYAQAIEEKWVRAYVLNVLSKRFEYAQAEVWHGQSRYETIISTYLPKFLPEVLTYLPKGLLKNALSEIWTTSNDGNRAEMLSGLVNSLHLNEQDQLFDALSVIQERKERTELEDGFINYSWDGEPEQVLVLAQKIKDDSIRSRVLVALAERSPEVADKVLAAVQTINDEKIIFHAVGKFIKRLPKYELEQMLQALNEMEDQKDRIEVLLTLLRPLPERSEHVLKLARTISNEPNRAIILGILSNNIPDIAFEAITSAQMIQNETKRSSILSILVTLLPEIKRNQALEAIRSIQSDWKRAEVLSLLAELLPEVADEALEATRKIWNERLLADTLFILTQRLPENKLADVLEMTRRIKDEDDRAKVLFGLTQRLPDDVLDQLLSAARELRKEEYRIFVLVPLSNRLPEALIVAGGLGHILKIIRTIQDNYQRTMVLSALSKLLPEMADDALSVAYTMGDDVFTHEAMMALANLLPKKQLFQMLKQVMSIQDHQKRANNLNIVAQYLPVVVGDTSKIIQSVRARRKNTDILSNLEPPIRQLYHYVDDFLFSPSYRIRANLCLDFVALMPIILHFGTEDTPHEIYEAVRDVTTWWP